jgi:hypothetical protein
MTPHIPEERSTMIDWHAFAISCRSNNSALPARLPVTVCVELRINTASATRLETQFRAAGAERGAWMTGG